jgi:hypothetical protein
VTDALVAQLVRKLRLPPGGRDMVVLLHELVVRYPAAAAAAAARRERITATLVERGEPGGITAMARTVGLPAALAAGLVLDGEIDLAGCHIPTEPAVYGPVLAELEREGVRFAEKTEPVGPGSREPEGVIA